MIDLVLWYQGGHLILIEYYDADTTSPIKSWSWYMSTSNVMVDPLTKMIMRDVLLTHIRSLELHKFLCIFGYHFLLTFLSMSIVCMCALWIWIPWIMNTIYCINCFLFYFSSSLHWLLKWLCSNNKQDDNSFVTQKPSKINQI